MIAATLVWLLACFYFTFGAFEHMLKNGEGVVAAFFAVLILGMIPTVPYAVAMSVLAAVYVVLKK